MTRKSVSVIAIILMLLSVNVLAQNSTSSPYSLFGVGIITPKEDAAAAGMGHTGVALAPSEWVNIANPAGICGLDSMTFYFNFQLKWFYAREETSNEKQSVYSANIDGISMGYRCTRWWCMALGYAPYSTVGYDMNEKRYIVGTETKYTVKHSGSGGLQQAYITNAFTLFRHLTLGANVSMLWGSIEKLETAIFSGVLSGEDIYNSKVYTMNNMFYEFGLQYDFNIGRNNFRLGGMFNQKTHLWSSYDHLVYNDVSSELFFDDVTPLKEDFYVPMSYAAGLGYTRNRLIVTADYKFSKWSDVTNSKFGETVKYTDSWVAGIGLQYSAGATGDPFYKRLRYRLGYSFTKDYLEMRGVNLNNYNITAGLTIPMGRWSNALTEDYEYMQRGAVFNGMEMVRYHNLKVALNIRETWFVKSKFD